MAIDRFNDKFTEPTIAEPTVFTQYRSNGKSTAQGAFWTARDAISSYVLTDCSPTAFGYIGDKSIDSVVAVAKNLPEVQEFLALAGSSPMLQQLYKHWINDAISGALKSYINQKC
jgi:hypothetical protein